LQFNADEGTQHDRMNLTDVLENPKALLVIFGKSPSLSGVDLTDVVYDRELRSLKPLLGVFAEHEFANFLGGPSNCEMQIANRRMRRGRICAKLAGKNLRIDRLIAVNESEQRELEDFFSAYFHRDWMVDDPKPEAVVDRFAMTLSPYRRTEFAKLLRRFRDSYETDKQLEEIMCGQLGSYYAPSGAGESAKAWLTRLSSKFDELSS
jgi:hypothetical protein